MYVCGRGYEDDRVPHVPRRWKKKVEKCIDASYEIEREVKDQCPVESEFEDVWDGFSSEDV